MLEKDYLVRQLKEIIKICLSLTGNIAETAEENQDDEDREARLAKALSLLDEAIENSTRLAPDFVRATPPQMIAAMITRDRTPVEILEILKLLVEKSRVFRLLGQPSDEKHIKAIVQTCLSQIEKDELAKADQTSYGHISKRIAE
jgi:hypothetical protein